MQMNLSIPVRKPKLSPTTPIKMQNNRDLVAVFTNARDEPEITQWIAHYIGLGFDKIYIFDHLSVVPIKTQIPQKWRKIVTVIDYNRPVIAGNTLKPTLMQYAVNISLENKIKWMLYVDADEYLCLNTHATIKPFINTYANLGAAAITFNWLMFGTNGHLQNPTDVLIVDAFTQSDEHLNEHVKTIVRPEYVSGIINPHFFNLIPGGLIFNACKSQPQAESPFFYEGLRYAPSEVSAFIAHYYVQSVETYARRKGRVMDDGTLPRDMKVNIHGFHNVAKTTMVQTRYSAKIRKILDDSIIEPESKLKSKIARIRPQKTGENVPSVAI